MHKRGYYTQRAFAHAMEMADQNVSRLFNMDRATISEKTLDRMCRTLRCQPGDILAYQTDEDQPAP